MVELEQRVKTGDLTCPANLHGQFCFLDGTTPCREKDKGKCIKYLTVKQKSQQYGKGAVIDGGY